MEIGIYGGTFNPIHLGHMAAARHAAAALALDQLYLVPDRIPPHKKLDGVSPDGEDRLEMTRLAAESLGLPRGECIVSDAEQHRKGKSYTIDTLRAFRYAHPEDRIWLLMGTDMFLTFHQWRDPGEILKLCGLCAFRRSGGDQAELFARQKEFLERKYGGEIRVADLPEVVEISSTRLRSALAAEVPGGPPGEGAAYLCPPVYGYILRRRLYGTAEDPKRLPLDKLRPVALSHLKGSRIPHVLGVEETAAALARRWGADEQSARRAALFHDSTKRLSYQEQLALCRKWEIPLDPCEQKEGKLLHAKTGAVFAGRYYGLTEEECSAIFWHTTGKADMSLLEKIIYLADYIEPNRDFCDLTELRQLAFSDLDRAMLLGFTMAVRDLGTQGGVIHSNSVAARDYLKGRLP